MSASQTASPRACVGCGADVDSRDPRQLHCTPACGNRKRQRDLKRRRRLGLTATPLVRFDDAEERLVELVAAGQVRGWRALEELVERVRSKAVAA